MKTDREMMDWLSSRKIDGCFVKGYLIDEGMIMKFASKLPGTYPTLRQAICAAIKKSGSKEGK